MENFTDDTIVAVASFLSPRDMSSLALTCKQFGAKNGTKRSSVREEGTRNVRQKTESISLMEVAIQNGQLYCQLCEEKDCVHIGYVFGLPDVYEVLNAKGIKQTR